MHLSKQQKHTKSNPLDYWRVGPQPRCCPPAPSFRAPHSTDRPTVSASARLRPLILIIGPSVWSGWEATDLLLFFLCLPSLGRREPHVIQLHFLFAKLALSVHSGSVINRSQALSAKRSQKGIKSNREHLFSKAAHKSSYLLISAVGAAR